MKRFGDFTVDTKNLNGSEAWDDKLATKFLGCIKTVRKWFNEYGCGLVGKAVDSDISGPLFESSHWSILFIVSVDWIEKTKINKNRQQMNGPILFTIQQTQATEFFLNGPSPVSFSFIFGLFLKQTSIQFYHKLMWKMSIQYTALGFEPTTFRMCLLPYSLHLGSRDWIITPPPPPQYNENNKNEIIYFFESTSNGRLINSNNDDNASCIKTTRQWQLR